jgi:hypothetical protein
MDWGRANDAFQTATVTGNRVQAALRANIIRLEKEQQGRTLTSEQVRIVAGRLKDLGVLDQPIYLEALQGDREAIQLAKLIKQGFEMAGVPVDGVSEQIRIASPGPGIAIWQRSKEDRRGAVVKDALAAVGLESRLVEVKRHKSVWRRSTAPRENRHEPAHRCAACARSGCRSSRGDRRAAGR